MAEALDAVDPSREEIPAVEGESSVRSPEVQDEVRASCEPGDGPHEEGVLGSSALASVLEGPGWRHQMLDMWEG